MRIDPSLCYLSGADALELFRLRQLAPSELLESQHARSATLNANVNALADTYFEAAIGKAKAADARWSKRGDPRPLEGLPVAVKDAQGIAGKRTTFGSLVHQNNVAALTDPMIERLEAAGAIVHVRTTTSEFCLSGVCSSPLWGTTRNPWNLAYGPGGSSGGSAAALAAGFTTLATGTDMGGSIRVPASSCGVVGYKPPHGRNPDAPPLNLDRFSHCGPLARSVRDVALMQNEISGPHARDYDSLRDRVRLSLHPEPIAGLRVAYSLDLDYREVDADVRRNTLEALDVFRSLGCSVEQVCLGWTEEIDRAYAQWFALMPLGREIARCAESEPGMLSAYVLSVAESIRSPARPEHVSVVLEVTNRIYATFGEIMETHDIFVCPTMTIPAVRADHDPLDPGFRIGDVVVDPEFGYSTTHQFNMLSHCPAISVPSGFSAAGVPTGVQIVGRTFDDATVFRAAVAYECERGAWYEAEALRPRLIP